jgi:hypothetical protein
VRAYSHKERKVSEFIISFDNLLTYLWPKTVLLICLGREFIQKLINEFVIS